MDVMEKLVELIRRAITIWDKGDVSVAIAEHLIANGVTVQEWISVNEHLPQDDLPFGALCEIVQVLLDDGTVTVGWCNKGLKCWYYMPIQATNFVGHDYNKTPVVAWKPLSQPPKGE